MRLKINVEVYITPSRKNPIGQIQLEGNLSMIAAYAIFSKFFLISARQCMFAKRILHPGGFLKYERYF